MVLIRDIVVLHITHVGELALAPLAIGVLQKHFV